MTKAKALAAALAGETLDQQRQRELIVAICNNMRDHAVKLVPKLPPEWDAHELREMLADQCDRERTALMREAKSKRWQRYKDYRNTLLINL